MSDHLPNELPEPYPFEPLQDASSQVRALRLKPADSSFCLIECELHLEKLHGSYFVAFYTPLDDQLEEDHLIICNGDFRAVSETLYSCLRQLRVDGVQEVWLPALCVDWKNVEEKRKQLTLWPEIFGKDAQWLPPQHSPLTDENTIRVLELEPAENDEEVLQARLYELSLETASDQCQYTYLEIPRVLTGDSWLDRTTIFCNERPICVSSYLDTSLRYMRAQGTFRLWVDSICMDFADEKDVEHHNNIAKLIRVKASSIIEAYPPEFQYQPLVNASTPIRLLQVQPARYRHDPLVVDVTSFPIDQAPDFVALSYTWGSPESKGPIFMSSGSILPATENLIGALAHLRQRGFRTIWADAICINQDDIDERNQQVLLMGEIYRRAKRVVIELGITCSFEGYMKRHSYTQILVKILALTSRVLHAVRPECTVVKPPELAKFGLPPDKHRAWHSLREMRAAPWFTRSWIVQEAVANSSSQVDVVYNGRWYSWKDIIDANNVVQFEIMEVQSMVGKLAMNDMGFLGSALTSQTQYTLLDLVSAFRNMESTDPRDKLYAFRGLASDKLLAPLPDYSKSVEQVYSEFATYFVSQGYGMQLLCEAGTMRFSKMQTLPSWAAEWSFNADWGATNYNKGASHVMLETMTPEKCHYPSSKVILTQNPRVISVTGGGTDRILLLTPSVATRAQSEQYEDFQKSTKSLFNEARKIVQECIHVQERYGASLGRAFYKTIMGGETSSQLENYVESSGHLGERERGYTDSEHRVAVHGEASPSPMPPALFMQEFDRGIADHLGNRRFCVTQDGYIGLVSMLAEIGDLVVVLKGTKSRFLLRQTAQGRHVLIGDAYVHGMMHGEGMETLNVHFEEILIE